MAGTLSHSDMNGLIVAVGINDPFPIKIYLLSPINLRETIPISLKRLSPFKAIVFNWNAVAAGISTNT